MNSTKGILSKLFAIFLFSIMASLIKATADAVPPWQAVFFRSFFAMPVIIIWLAQRGELRTGLKVNNPMGHVWRGLIGTTAMVLTFASLGLLPLPDATSIGFTAPLMMVVFAAMFLNERVRLFRISAVLIGLVGVGIIFYPRLTLFDGGGPETLALLGAVVALGAAMVRALAHIHIRKLTQTDQTSAIVFYFSLTSTTIGLLSLPFGWVMPSAMDFALLVAAGLIGGTAQIFLTTGYKYAEASTLAPFEYVSMIFAVVIGYFVFAEVPTSATLIGSGIIILAGIAIIWREHQLGLKRGKARPSMTPQG